MGFYYCEVATQQLMGLCSRSQPPLVQTQTVTITAASTSLPSDISTTEVPIVPTKTFTYESTKVGRSSQEPVRRYRCTCRIRQARTKIKTCGEARGNDPLFVMTSLHPFFTNYYSLFFRLASQVTGDDEDRDDSTVSTSKTISSESTCGSAVTTTKISKVSCALLASRILFFTRPAHVFPV